MRKVILSFLVTIAVLVGMVGCGSTTAAPTATVHKEAPSRGKCLAAMRRALAQNKDTDIEPKQCHGLSDKVTASLARVAFEDYMKSQGWDATVEPEN